MDRKLSGRFSLVARKEGSIAVGLLGDVDVDALTYGQLRSLVEFYVDGWFIVNNVNILREKDFAVGGSRIPLKNFKQVVEFNFTRLNRNLFTDSEYAALRSMEEADGFDLYDMRYTAA